jgi:hypothetical protein
MRLPLLSRFAVPLLLTVPLWAAESLSGTWVLDVEKSRWNQARKPISLVLTVEHNEPELKYSGRILYVDEESRPFSFQGAVDGKEYRMNRSFGPGNVVLERENARTFRSTYRSDCGRYTESARTSLSSDGKWLTREIRLETPAGRYNWTEVYERK